MPRPQVWKIVIAKQFCHQNISQHVLNLLIFDLSCAAADVMKLVFSYFITPTQILFFFFLWAQPWLYFTSCHHQSNVSVLTRCCDIQPGVPTTAQISNITQSDKTPVTRPFNSWSCFQTPSPSLLLRTECISWLDIVAVALPYQVGCWMGSLDHSGRGIALVQAVTADCRHKVYWCRKICSTANPTLRPGNLLEQICSSAPLTSSCAGFSFFSFSYLASALAFSYSCVLVL